jgi:hypothetical protein
MSDLLAELAEAEALAERLRRRVAAAPCAEVGHDWHRIGGSNAGCDDNWCCCSVPVHICAKCSDCDYGDNHEGDEVRKRCAVMNGMSDS